MIRFQGLAVGLMCALVFNGASDVLAAKKTMKKHIAQQATRKVAPRTKTSTRKNVVARKPTTGLQEMDGITILSAGGEYAMPSRPVAPGSALRRTAATLPARVSASSPLGHRHGNYDTRSIAPLTSSPAREVDGKVFPPQFETMATDWQPINLNQYRGKVVLLDFWGTWCPPSRDETPALVPLYRKFRAAGFEIVGISLDTRRSEMDSFVRKHTLGWRQIFGGKQWESDLVQLYEITSIPETVLIDRDGSVLAVGLRGEMLDAAVELAVKGKWDEAMRDAMKEVEKEANSESKLRNVQ